MNISQSRVWIGAIIIIGVAFLAGLLYFTGKAEDSKNNFADKNVTSTNATTGAVLKTNLGEIEVTFFPDKAPQTVYNFTTLADQGFYDGTRFHRVIQDFMIQGGDPFSKDVSLKNRWGTGGPGYMFKDEINDEKLVRGTLAMANSGPNTNGSQFFIVTAEATPWLDGKHTVFGKVVKGMDIVDKISTADKDSNDRPIQDIIIEKVILK